MSTQRCVHGGVSGVLAGRAFVPLCRTDRPGNVLAAFLGALNVLSMEDLMNIEVASAALSFAEDKFLHAHHAGFGCPGASREKTIRSIFGKAIWRF